MFTTSLGDRQGVGYHLILPAYLCSTWHQLEDCVHSSPEATHTPGSGLGRAGSWAREQLGLLTHTSLHSSCWAAGLHTGSGLPGKRKLGTHHIPFSKLESGATQYHFCLSALQACHQIPPSNEGRTIRFRLRMGSMSKKCVTMTVNMCFNSPHKTGAMVLF